MTEKIAHTAKLVHEVNRAYCIALGDYSQLPWDEAPQWQKESVFNGIQFHLANPNTTPEDSHANWYKVKLEDGWVYGPVKDAEKKEHPCMVPYAELPLDQRVKDHLFTAIVRTELGD